MNLILWCSYMKWLFAYECFHYFHFSCREHRRTMGGFLWQIPSHRRILSCWPISDWFWDCVINVNDCVHEGHTAKHTGNTTEYNKSLFWWCNPINPFDLYSTSYRPIEAFIPCRTITLDDSVLLYTALSATFVVLHTNTVVTMETKWLLRRSARQLPPIYTHI